MVRRDVIEEVFDDLAPEIYKISSSKGWDVPHSFDNVDALARKLCLIHSEVSEALEAVRVDDFENFKEELADTVIRILHLSAGLRIDLGKEILAKVERNRRRSHKHGNKRI